MADSKSRKSEGVSFGDTISYGDSISQGGISRESRRQRHLGKNQRRTTQMTETRKLLFRPRVYESWREGDLDFDSAERERLMKDIAIKEERLQDKRKKRMDNGGGPEEFSDSSEENQVVNELDKLKSRKQREEEYREKLIRDKTRHEEEEMMEMEEKLASELQNPSIYGWFYTDGYYDNAPYFGVREDLVEKLDADQQEWYEKWQKKYPESFTSMFKRFFWPPKRKCKMFRTRGSYLDFPEVIADWPKGVDVNFEREPREYITNRHELFGLTEEQKEQDAQELEAALAAEVEEEESEPVPGTKVKRPPKTFVDFDTDSDKLDSNAWYYDDEEGEFFKKKLGFDIEYYYDGINQCWRHKKKRGRYKSENQQSPYDYYFDDSTTQFVPREEFMSLDELVYDPKTGVYRIHVISKKAAKKSKSGKDIMEFPKFKVETKFEYNEEGESIGIVGEAVKKHSPNSYYFDEEFGKWILRSELPKDVKSEDITFDENGKRYTRKFEGVWRGLTGYSPDDYYWSDRVRKFYPKPPRQPDNFKYYQQDGVWRKMDEVTPTTTFHQEDITRFYFDDFEGQFKPKDFTVGTRSVYIQGKYSRIWRKVAKPKSNTYPDDFYWDTYKKRWLPRAMRMDMRKNAEVARQKNIMEGQKGGMDVWDIKQNDKDTKPEDFFFDLEEGVFLKKRRNDEYYFDEQDNCWKMDNMKERPKLMRFIHEYYFDGEVGRFYLKEPNGNYTYDQDFHVWKKVGPPANLSSARPPPDHFYFDLTTEVFKEKGSESFVYDNNLMWEVMPSSDPNFKCPDDYFFNETEGRFYPKDEEEAKSKNYVYDQQLGCWKLKGVKGPNQTGLSARNFFWDDSTRTFKLKVSAKEKTDYYFDSNNKIFRHILSSGRTRSGLRPGDFSWNVEYRAFIPMASLRKQRVNITDDLPKWDPLREYDKPWISDASLRRTDTDNDSSQSKSKNTAKFMTIKPNKVAPGNK